MANRAIGPDGKYTQDFLDYIEQHKKDVKNRGIKPASVEELESDYNTYNIDNILAMPLLREKELTPEEKRRIKKMKEAARRVPKRLEILRLAKAIKSKMNNQDLDESVYQKLAIQYNIWKAKSKPPKGEMTLIEAQRLLDKEIRDKYGGLKRDAEKEEARRAKNREKKKRQKARRKARAAELSGPKSWADYTDDDDADGGGEGKSNEPVIPVSEEVAVPEVRGRKMFFSTDPRENPYIFTESKAPIIKDIPLNQVVLIVAPSGFFHDIPNSQIYDSFDNAFGNVLLIQRQSRDRVLIVFNDSKTAETLIRQCNGGCRIKHPFEDREIQFYVMPWKDTMETVSYTHLRAHET